MNCQECKDRMYPENPSQPFLLNGKYLRPICESCPYYSPEKQEPEILEPTEIKQLHYQVEQARAGFLYLQNRLNEHLDKESKRKINVL